MGTVLLDMAMSLDGFVSGPGGGDDGLHDWYFAPSGAVPAVIAELIEGIGAMVLGRRVLGDQPVGFDTPYKVPHYVLTRTARPTAVYGEVPFIFAHEGVEQAVAQAQAAAGDKLVCVAGGAETAQRLLGAGLIDEIQIHLVSRLLGGGLRLFEGLEAINLERTRVLESPGVTHLRFRITR